MNQARVDIDRTETKVARCGDIEVRALAAYTDDRVLQYSHRLPGAVWGCGTIDKTLARDLALALLAFLGEQT